MRRHKVSTLKNLIEKYIKSVIIHGKESWSGDNKIANKHFKAYTKCFVEICKYGNEGEESLKELLSHESHFVRYSAAYHMLPFDSDTSIKMLKKCKSEPDGVGFNAKTTLSEWKSGNLRFPVDRDGKIAYVTVDEFIAMVNKYIGFTE